MVDRLPVALDRRMRDALMPMHLRVSKSGHILDAGPTLLKLHPDRDMRGMRLLEVFAFIQPEATSGLASDLLQLGDRSVELKLRQGKGTRFKGMMLGLPDEEGLFFNLSFGISALAAIEDHDLTNSDFAPTDLTVELLYLKEANNAVTRALYRQSEELESARASARQQAMTDALTGLGNRRSLQATLEPLLQQGQPFTLMQLDLDGFKSVNDSLGHAAGDTVLEVVSRRLGAVTRAKDTILRVGGDEFVVILPDLVEPGRLDELGRDMISHIEEPIRTDAGMCRVSATIGYAQSTSYLSPCAADMSRDADLSLYEGKKAGKGVVIGHGDAGRAAPAMSAGA